MLTAVRKGEWTWYTTAPLSCTGNSCSAIAEVRKHPNVSCVERKTESKRGKREKRKERKKKEIKIEGEREIEKAGERDRESKKEGRKGRKRNKE